MQESRKRKLREKRRTMMRGNGGDRGKGEFVPLSLGTSDWNRIYLLPAEELMTARFVRNESDGREEMG
jgi:hypothetical protein